MNEVGFPPEWIQDRMEWASLISNTTEESLRTRRLPDWTPLKTNHLVYRKDPSSMRSITRKSPIQMIQVPRRRQRSPQASQVEASFLVMDYLRGADSNSIVCR